MINFRDSCLVGDMNEVICTQKHGFEKGSNSTLVTMLETQSQFGNNITVVNSKLPSVFPIKSQNTWSSPTMVNMGSYKVTTDLFFSTKVKNNATVLEFGITIPLGNFYTLVTGSRSATFAMKGAIKFAGFKGDNFAATLSAFTVDISKCISTNMLRQYFSANIVGNEGLTIYDCFLTGFNNQKLQPEDPLVKINLTYDWLGEKPAFSGTSLSYISDTVIHWLTDSLVFSSQVGACSSSESEGSSFVTSFPDVDDACSSSYEDDIDTD